MSSGRVSSDSPERDYVQSLSRGLTVLQAFNAERPAMTLADMARATGLTRATARRLLFTLVTLGYVCTDGRTFELTPRVLDLGFAYVSSLQLPDIAQPFMEALSDRVHESVSASVLDGTQIVYVARVNTQRIMGISLAIGSRLPAAWTSMGRVLLAGLVRGTSRRVPRRAGHHRTDIAIDHRHRRPAHRGARRAHPGIRTGRPGARGRHQIRRRTIARSTRPNVGGDQRRHPRGAGHAQGVARSHPARTPGRGAQHRDAVGEAMNRASSSPHRSRRGPRRSPPPSRHRCHDGRGDRRLHCPHPSAPRRTRVGQGRSAGDPGEELRSDGRVRSRFSQRCSPASAAGRATIPATPRDEPTPTPPSELSNALLQALQLGDEAQIAMLAQQAVEALAGFDDDAEHSERYYLHKVMRAIDLSRMLERRDATTPSRGRADRARADAGSQRVRGDARTVPPPTGSRNRDADGRRSRSRMTSTSARRWPTATCCSCRRWSSTNSAA